MGSMFRKNTAATPNLIAHRGLAVNAPQNSIASFEAAGANGFWAIETDVHKTADGILVCCHDSTVDSMFDGHGSICEMTFSQLRALSFRAEKSNGCSNCGCMPTFDEYLQICKRYGSIPFIETKTADISDVLEAAASYFAEDEFLISSSRFSHLEAVREITDKVFVHHIFSDELKMLRLSELGNSGLSYNYPDYTKCPRQLLERTHAAGVKICLRAGDTQRAVLDMIEMGLDYIPTNVISSVDP